MNRTSTASIRTAAVLLALSLLTVPATAGAQEQHVVEPGELDEAAASHRAEDQVRRDAILDALERRRVEEVAERLDVDLVEARDAVRTLDGAALERAAERARRLNRTLAGGAATITLSTTALVIALLVLLILVMD